MIQTLFDISGDSTYEKMFSYFTKRVHDTDVSQFQQFWTLRVGMVVLVLSSITVLSFVVVLRFFPLKNIFWLHFTFR